jgi:hypothetical protein
MRKNIALVAVLTIVFVLAIVWTAGAQRPEPPPPPPSPDTSRFSAPLGATPTPAPNERRPDDVGPPTVTPIPFKEVIDKADGTIPEVEKVTIIVRKGNGDYVKILMSPQQLENARGKDLHSVLGLSPEDDIDIIPPESLMRRQIPPPTP